MWLYKSLKPACKLYEVDIGIYIGMHITRYSLKG